MKKSTKLVALALCVLMAAVVFAGCASEQQSAPDTSEQQSALDKIKAAGEIVMLTNPAFPPFEYLGTDNEIVGVDVEIANAIANEIGVKLKIVDMDFDGIISAVQSGKGDLGVAGITATDERRESVDFSVNYVDTAQYIIVKSDNTDITSADDLAGKNVGVQNGTTGDIYVTDNTTAVPYRYKTASDAAIELNNGKLDAVVIDEMPANEIVSTYSGLKLIDTPLTEEQYAIAIAKGNDDLKEVVDKVLNELLESGQIDQWIEEYKASSDS